MAEKKSGVSSEPVSFLVEGLNGGKGPTPGGGGSQGNMAALQAMFPGLDLGSIPTGAAGGGREAAPPSIAEMLLGTSYEVTGRNALGGSPVGDLPLWAQDAATKVHMAVTQPGHSPEWYAQAQGNARDFDPFLGVISQQGDERVFLGEADFKLPKNWAGTMKDTTGMSPRAIEEASRKDAQMAKKGHAKDDDTQTATQVKNQPFLWDDDKVADTMKRMRLAGIPVKSFEDMTAAWGSMVDRAATTYSLSAGQKKVTPWDVLDMYKSEAKASGSYVDYEQRMNGSQTSVSRSVSELTEGESFTALQSKLSEMLGRDPSDQEVRDFAYRMNHLAAQNPSITKTITRFKNGEAVGSNSTTHGGFSADDVVQHAYEDAQDDPHYAEYQSATTYFNAAMSALGGMGEG